MKRFILVGTAILVIAGLYTGKTMAKNRVSAYVDKTVTTSSLDLSLCVSGAGIDDKGNMQTNGINTIDDTIEQRVSVLNSGDKKDNIWKKVGKAISIENIFVPLIILIIFGTFYLQNSNSLGNKGFIFIMYPQFKTVTLYISFIIVEFIAYFIAMGRPAMKYRFYWITLIELILLPLYRMGMYNDFCMRASIPSIMILMTIMLNYCLDKQLNNISIKRRKLVIVFMLIGYLTSATEIQRNVKETLNNSQDTYLQETFYSLADLKPDMKNQVELNLNQYMALNYKDSFFYKYIAVR